MCLNRRIIQDNRLNFFPIPDRFSRSLIAEDVVYCYEARSLGYRVLLDTTVQTTHLRSPEVRPWEVAMRGYDWRSFPV